MSDTDADLTALITDVRAKEGHACGYSLCDEVSGEVYPCDRPGVSWRWYQGHDHEDMLDRACALHENAGGLLVVRLVDAVERLTRERDDARAENERLRREYTPCDLDLLSRAEAAEAEVADLRTRLADAGATIQRVRGVVEDRLTRDYGYEDEARVAERNAGYLVLRALDDPQDGGDIFDDGGRRYPAVLPTIPQDGGEGR